MIDQDTKNGRPRNLAVETLPEFEKRYRDVRVDIFFDGIKSDISNYSHYIRVTATHRKTGHLLTRRIWIQKGKSTDMDHLTQQSWILERTILDTE